MTKYAIIQSSVAVEIFTPQEGFTLEESWPPEHAVLFSEVPDEVTPNSVIDDKGKWTIAQIAPPVPDPVLYQKVTPMTFQMLFTSSERIAIKKAVPTDPVIEDWWSLVTNPQLTEVDLNLSSVHEALDYLVTLKIISNERKLEILSVHVK